MLKSYVSAIRCNNNYKSEENKKELLFWRKQMRNHSTMVREWDIERRSDELNPNKHLKSYLMDCSRLRAMVFMFTISRFLHVESQKEDNFVSEFAMLFYLGFDYNKLYKDTRMAKQAFQDIIGFPFHDRYRKQEQKPVVRYHLTEEQISLLAIIDGYFDMEVRQHMFYDVENYYNNLPNEMEELKKYSRDELEALLVKLYDVNDIVEERNKLNV